MVCCVGSLEMPASGVGAQPVAEHIGTATNLESLISITMLCLKKFVEGQS